MKLVIELGPGAHEDFDDAIFWYEEQERGLGRKLIHAINEALSRIQLSPFSFPVIHGMNVRRAVVGKFPFLIIFVPESERIFVYAVFHTCRNPIIWRGRID